MAASKEQKEQAKEFLDLLKKSKGSLKVYFAVGKGSDGPGVHVDKKKPKFCVTTLKAKRITTMLASGQVKMEDPLTLYCLKEPNENAVKKAFFQFFKESEVSIPGVTESKIRVLGPKEWDSAAEDEEAEGKSAEASAPAAEPQTDPSAELKEKYQKLVPQMNAKIAARPELKAPLERVDKVFQNELRSGAFDQARTTLEELTKLVQGVPAPPAARASAAPAEGAAAPPEPKQAGNELVAAYQKLIPEMKRKAAEQPPLQEPLTRAAKQFQEALNAGKFQDAKRTLDQLAQILAKPAASAGPEGLGQQFAKRYAALKPRLEEAFRANRGDVSKMRAGVQFAVETANEKQFDRALKALDQLERLLDAAAASGTGTSAQPSGSLVAYRTSLLEFDSAKKAVFARIDALKSKIPAELPDEVDFADRLADELRDLLDEIDDAVIDAINASQDEAEPVNAAVKTSIAAALNQLQSNPLVKHVDKNPFGVSTAIETTLGAALSKVTKAMPAMA